METFGGTLPVESMILMIISIFLFFGLPILFIVSLIQTMMKGTTFWKVVNAVSGVCSLGMLAAAVYFVSQGARKEMAKVKQPHVYHTADGLASMTGPGGWRRLSLESHDATLQVGNLFREEFMVVIPEPRKDFPNGFTCEQFAKAAAKISAEEIDNSKVTEPSKVELNGLDAYRIQISGIVDQTEIDYFNTYVKGRDNFYQILAWTLPGKREEAFPRFRKAVSSFHEMPSQGQLISKR